jgi:hypothetical protein
VNRVIRDFEGVNPPLINNFFITSLKKRKFSSDSYLDKMKVVFDYIESYWKKTGKDLAREPFDLEECFTILTLQLRDALRKGLSEDALRLSRVQFSLKSFVAELLSEFEIQSYSSVRMQQFGMKLWAEKPNIISFNYDTIIESVLASASGLSDWILRGERYPKSDPGNVVPTGELSFSHLKWNLPLGYGVEFDRVEIQRAGVPPIVDGVRFYSNPDNRLYPWSVLKMHGSLNWFRYLPIRSFPTLPGEPEAELSTDKRQQVILMRRSWWFNQPPDFEGWYVDPVILTPGLFKYEALGEDPLYDRVFGTIWTKAKEALSTAKKLVVIGYSFPVTDVSTRRLFLESLQRNRLSELVVVNPNQSVLDKTKEICQMKTNVTQYEGFEEYLQSLPVDPVTEARLEFEKEVTSKS